MIHQTVLKNLREMQEDQNTIRKQRAGRADYYCSSASAAGDDQASGGVEHGSVRGMLVGSADVAGIAVASANDDDMDNIAVCLTRSVGCSNVPKLLNSELHIQPGSTIGEDIQTTLLSGTTPLCLQGVSTIHSGNQRSVRHSILSIAHTLICSGLQGGWVSTCGAPCNRNAKCKSSTEQPAAKTWCKFAHKLQGSLDRTTPVYQWQVVLPLLSLPSPCQQG